MTLRKKQPICRLSDCSKKAKLDNNSYHILNEYYCCDEHYQKDIKEFSKGKVIRRFLKQKLYELGIIPTGIVGFIFLPYWMGWGVIKLFKIDYLHNLLICNKIDTNEKIISNFGGIESLKKVCDGINYDPFSIWFIGMLTLVISGGFIAYNWHLAKESVLKEFRKKYENN